MEKVGVEEEKKYIYINSRSINGTLKASTTNRS